MSVYEIMSCGFIYKNPTKDKVCLLRKNPHFLHRDADDTYYGVFAEIPELNEFLVEKPIVEQVVENIEQTAEEPVVVINE